MLVETKMIHNRGNKRNEAVEKTKMKDFVKTEEVLAAVKNGDENLL